MQWMKAHVTNDSAGPCTPIVSTFFNLITVLALVKQLTEPVMQSAWQAVTLRTTTCLYLFIHNP